MGDENVPFGYLEPGRIGSKQDRIVGFAVWGSPELAGGGCIGNGGKCRQKLDLRRSEGTRT